MINFTFFISYFLIIVIVVVNSDTDFARLSDFNIAQQRKQLLKERDQTKPYMEF